MAEHPVDELIRICGRHERYRQRLNSGGVLVPHAREDMGACQRRIQELRDLIKGAMVDPEEDAE